jgi:hypothetical protein
MDAADQLFYRANYRIRRLAHQQWHRGQSKQQILRSQVGFAETGSSRPAACQGCSNYHGLSYGMSRATRTQLVCAMHPYGWESSDRCPDWSDT